jgi:peptidase E
VYKNLTVLGPQRPDPNLPQVLDLLGVRGPVAMITAGWRHDEGETAALEKALARPHAHVPLYQWFDRVMAGDAELARAYSERSERMRAYKELYRIRVRGALGVVERLLEHRDEMPDLVDRELVRAIDTVRDVDDQMLASLRDVRVAFPRMARSIEHAEVKAHHDEAARVIADADTIVVAGGHVAVLLNRLQFFGVHTLLQDALEAGKAVIAWSAGAMVMTNRIALFYDDPPDGPAEAEVLDNGLGFLPGVVLYPHARRRLRIHDANRIARLARRFAPAESIGIENGAWLERTPEGWANRGDPRRAFRLGIDGSIDSLTFADDEPSVDHVSP